MKALLIKTDRACEVVEIDGLADMQAAVGGMIEAVPLDGVPGDVILNENGKFSGLTYNPLATAIARLFPGDAIMGDVLVTGPVDAEGETTDLTAEAISVVAANQHTL